MGNCVRREVGLEIEDNEGDITSMEKFRKELVTYKIIFYTYERL